MALPAMSLLALPYVRRELPGWGTVARYAGIFDERRWRGADTRTIRGKLHGYQLYLDLANWSERQTFFLGRFYELETQLTIRALLERGDTLVDVGANIGMITLVGARSVGPSGRVYSIEPQPEAFGRLENHITRNHLQQVTALQLGLSDEPGALRLATLAGHTGMSTFASLGAAQQQAVSGSYEARVERGDEVLAGAPAAAPMVIKIDVEGFEIRVLRGLRQTLRRHRPAVITELVPDHLRRAGFEPEQLFELMNEAEYRSFQMTTRREGLRHRLSLRPLSARSLRLGQIKQANVLWVRDSGPHLSRITRYVVPS